jgi:hypothetical protein
VPRVEEARADEVIGDFTLMNESSDEIRECFDSVIDEIFDEAWATGAKRFACDMVVQYTCDYWGDNDEDISWKLHPLTKEEP